jgi:hypothetical protein
MDAMEIARAARALYATAHWLHSEERVGDAACVFRAMVSVAPEDERGWLGLGTCHEALGQPKVALAIYESGGVVADGARCEIARSRLLRCMGRVDEAEEALAHASELAERGDPETMALVAHERRQ